MSFATETTVLIVQVAASAALSVASIYAGVKAFDWFTKGIEELKEIKKGNVAVGIVLGAIVIAISLMIAGGIARFAAGLSVDAPIADLLWGAFWNILLVVFRLVVAILTIFISFAVLDTLTADIDEVKELKRGNVAIALVIAAVVLAVSMLMASALG